MRTLNPRLEALAPSSLDLAVPNSGPRLMISLASLPRLASLLVFGFLGLAPGAFATASPILFYGGSFCPPHRAHLEEASRAAEFLAAQAVVFTPASDEAVQYNPVRHSASWAHVSAQERWAMTFLATRGDPRFRVSAREVARKDRNYSSSKTLLEAARTYGDQLWVLVGSDLLPKLKDWDQIDQVLGKVNLLVNAYPPHPLLPWEEVMPESLAGEYQKLSPSSWRSPQGKEIRYVNLEVPGLSSRKVRDQLERGLSTQSSLNPWVRAYIDHHQLFQGPGGRP